MRPIAFRFLVVLLSVAVLPLQGRAQEAAEAVAQAAPAPEKKDEPPLRPEDILRLPLDRLGTVSTRPASGFDTPATSVTRSLQIPTAEGAASGISSVSATVGRSPAAVYVLTAEDIERSGQRTIPDLLRMVPGMEVARIDANKWAVTSRGFETRFATKLLVQIDGRSIYTPAFSGVYWDERDTLLEDLERIEVIRGPGATLWGANAVNGIISIITKPASQTQGLLLGGLSAGDEPYQGFVRYGSTLGDNGHYRVYVKYFDWNNGVGLNGVPGNDGWDQYRAGFRADWRLSADETFMFQGDLFNGRLGDVLTVPLFVSPYSAFVDENIKTQGGYVQARYSRVFSPESDLSLQVYYDRTQRSEFLIGENRDIIDVDFQHRFPLGASQEVIYGLGYRFTTDEFRNSLNIQLLPNQRSDHFVSAFVQDDVKVVPDRLHFIFGAKFEFNDYTGFESQPSARLLWTPTEQQTAWAAVSRAVRIPDRGIENIRQVLEVIPPDANNPFPVVPTFFGQPSVVSEEVIAYEAGWRISPTRSFLFDIAAFYNQYDHLIGSQDLEPIFVTDPVPYLLVPVVAGNPVEGYTCGVEIASTWKVTDYWQLHAGYTWLTMQLGPGDTSANREIPHNQYNMRSFLNVTPNLKFDLGLYYVDNLAQFNVPHYTRLDARLAWEPRSGCEVVLGMQNMLEPRHLEFVQPSPAVMSTLAERTVYGMVRLRY